MRADFGEVENRICGAFLGDVVSIPQSVFIHRTKVKIHYVIRCRTSCKVVLKSKRDSIKHKQQLKNDGRWHYYNFTLPETGEYEMYVSNRYKDLVQYDIRICN